MTEKKEARRSGGAQTSEVTDLLRSWNAGDPDAAAAVMPLVYEELHRIATAYFRRERRDHTLQATAIVHDAYIRLIEHNNVEWQSRTHFVGTVAHMIRCVLVDHARHRAVAKRGGQARYLTLAEADALELKRAPDLLRLDDALGDLAKLDPRKAAIVELRFFGGLTIEETADFLNISVNTVSRHWRRARAWLYGQLKSDHSTPA